VTTWSPDGGAILGKGGNFRRWDLVGEGRSLECAFKGYIGTLAFPFFATSGTVSSATYPLP
jgi:hypothetical protein